ncbi:MAG TPA: 50S ribosomal protein L29 [Candidatus Omnitrophica bacterium]|nr:MAG: 50S ribosomal protein L29 [Omnitrophica WOR_2 bacterium GWA2_53_43]HBO97284.1 50S ribosomal protein L29 [Candidatus Omnitrophota bacterium]HCI44839.1 50S ribosomal protein L29 [Candidatus Omnitrophota bacterium]
MKKNKGIRELNSEELVKKGKDLKKELYDLNYQRKMGNVEKPARFKALRKEIARALTILKERELEDERTSKKA